MRPPHDLVSDFRDDGKRNKGDAGGPWPCKWGDGRTALLRSKGPTMAMWTAIDDIGNPASAMCRPRGDLSLMHSIKQQRLPALLEKDVNGEGHGVEGSGGVLS